MPIRDRQFNLKRLYETMKSERKKDDTSLSMEDMVTDRKNILKNPDYVSNMAPFSKK